MGLFDHEFRLEEINRYNLPLKRLNEVIDWNIFRAPIERAFYKFKVPARGGRPSYDKLMMFKILILQRYYNLSDDQTEFQIKDMRQIGKKRIDSAIGLMNLTYNLFRFEQIIRFKNAMI